MAFLEQAQARGLSERTIEALSEEEYISEETLATLREEDMTIMNIKLAQRGLLRKWIEELKTSATQAHTAATTSTINMIKRSMDTCDSTRAGAGDGTTYGMSSMHEGFSDTQFGHLGSPTRTQRQPCEPAAAATSVTNSSDEAAGGKAGSSKLVSADDITRGLDDDTTKEVEAYIQQHGVQNVGQFLTQKLTLYKDMQINIAITGQSGAGKSSFINCIRNLNADEVGAAQVGVTETTRVIQPYPDPRNKNLIFWDLPGIGTPNFPKETYLQQVEIDKYDFFLILTSTRFTENDLYLGQQIHHLGKQFAFLRTKIDSDLENDKQDHPRTHDPKKMMTKIEQDCVNNLQSADLPTNSVFVISSNLAQRTQFDFPNLMDTIVQKAPSAKKTSMILSLTACSEKGIEEKKRELAKRIPCVAAKAVMCESNFGTQEDVIKEEVQVYVDQFGLTREHLDKLGVGVKTLSQEAARMVGDVWANVGFSLMRGLSTLISMPEKLVKGFTGQLEEEKEEIANRLHQILNKCADTAKEIIRQGQRGSADHSFLE